MIGILKSIGYESDDEIESDFRAATPTMAKLFHIMYTKNMKVEDLPWSGDSHTENESSMEESLIPSKEAQ